MRFPFKDASGHPLGEGCFVKVMRQSKYFTSPTSFSGLVTGVGDNMVEVRAWSHGKWSGGIRLARPSECLVRRKPPALRVEEQALVGAKLRSGMDKR